MTRVHTTTRGARLLVESQHDLPMVWVQVAIRGGAAGDPSGGDGFHHHLVSLSRRGAGGRTRLALDTELDELGASLECWAHRDAMMLSGLCLRRNLDRLCTIMADILAEPILAPEEHHKLIRETVRGLDEVRDDDGQLVIRFFHRDCLPGHPYARTVRGTEASLAAIDLDQIRAAQRRAVVPENLIIGFAGAIDDSESQRYCDRLLSRLPGDAAPPLPALITLERPRGRRVLVVDKPARQQSQIAIGHIAPRFGVEDTAALVLIEAVFGGMFTSRLMQEIRVKRGWSYGASCHWYRSRGPHWFNIHLAPQSEVTGDALAFTLTMLEALAERGLTDEELAFGKRYLAGNLAFQRATARRRLELAIKGQIFGLEDGFAERLPERLAGVSQGQTAAAAARWLHPDDTLSVVVATADDVLPSLDTVASATPRVVPYDSY